MMAQKMRPSCLLRSNLIPNINFDSENNARGALPSKLRITKHTDCYYYRINDSVIVIHSTHTRTQNEIITQLKMVRC